MLCARVGCQWKRPEEEQWRPSIFVVGPILPLLFLFSPHLLLLSQPIAGIIIAATALPPILRIREKNFLVYFLPLL